MPIYSLDITASGDARPATDTALTGPAAWRWWHYDLADPDLRPWAHQTLAAIPAQSLLMPETRPCCDAYSDGLMLNLRGVNLNADGPEDQMVAVRLWITDAAIVTVRVRNVRAIDDLAAQIQAGEAPATPMEFALQLARGLSGRIQTSVFDLAAEVDQLEEAAHEDAPLPDTLPALRRKAIRLRRYLGPQKDALVALAAEPLATPRATQLTELSNIAMLTVEELDGLTGRLTAISDHYTARAAEAQSRNSYALSIMAAVFLPLGFATGLFGVNVAGMPGLEAPAAFWLLSAAMALMAVAALALMRWLKWI